jgi:PAB1-binding protein PBP1
MDTKLKTPPELWASLFRDLVSKKISPNSKEFKERKREANRISKEVEREFRNNNFKQSKTN